MINFRLGLLILVLLSLLAACQSQARVADNTVAQKETGATAQTSVLQPSPTMTPQPTAILTGTTTPPPTATAELPTATPEPQPTATVEAAISCEPTPPDALGPFYLPGAPQRDSVGEGHILRGVVRSSADCAPLAGAQIEFWLAGPDGSYSDDYRATLFSGAEGAYQFESNAPPPYSGRPAHIHLRISAEGYQPLITQYYPSAGQTEGVFDLALRLGEATAAIDPPETEAAALTLPDVSAPTLFDISWNDREVFRAGLIEPEQDVLNELPGATIYHIDVAIGDDLVNVSGQQEVLYTNREDAPLNEIYFRLFPNLASGSTTISNLTVNGDPVEPIFEQQNSAMRVPLASPLQPGEEAVIHLGFAVRAPNGEGGNYGAFAYIRDVLALAHFYPMVAVYDDEGWNIEIATEIGDVVYADMSFYLVRVSAPADQTVLASGIEIERQATDGRRIMTFAAGPVRDFYLAASNRYHIVSQTIGQTTVNSYAPADLMAGAETALGQAIAAIDSFNRRFGTYPYTEFDMITTTTFALGIEYPGIVAILVDLYDEDAQVAGTPAHILLESVVAHEVAHQWFYNLVGNDQLDDPWLDEAMAQFLTIIYYSDVYGPNGAQGFHNSLHRRWSRVNGADIPIGRPVRDYTPEEYSAIVYGRGPLFIEALSQAMGAEAFADFLRDYYQTYQWDIATGEGFKALAEEHCGCDLTELFETWVY